MRTPLYILLFTLFFSVWNSHSQTSGSLQKTNIRFASKNEWGGLIGMGHIKGLDDVVIKNPEWAMELTSTNGIQIKQWFLGIGAGVRVWERDLTFPLFFHVSLDDLWKSHFFLSWRYWRPAWCKENQSLRRPGNRRFLCGLRIGV